LKVFKKGKGADYNGPRTTEGIVSYMTKQSLPSVNSVTGSEHPHFIKADKVVVVLYADATSTGYAEYAEAHREEFLFGHVADPAVAEAAGVSQPAIVVYRQFDEPKLIYSGSATSVDDATFGKWLKSNAVPLLDQVNGENYSAYADTGRPLAYLFVDPIEGQYEAIVESFKGLAKEYQGKINFAWIDAAKFAEHGKSLNLAPQWPAFVIQDVGKQLKYPFDQTKAFSPETIAPFVKDFFDGKLEPSLRSQPIPQYQTEPVFVLVTKEFEQVVFDDSKDVLVEFYAPWCGHCKRLAPIYDQLGEKFASVKDKVTIAKMDATENDVPPSAPFRVNGFPTIKFKAAGSREFIDYDGERTLEGFTEFIGKHAKNQFELPIISESPAVETPAATPATDKHAQEHVEL
jgi:protein disulfide-isomerase A1